MEKPDSTMRTSNAIMRRWGDIIGISNAITWQWGDTIGIGNNIMWQWGDTIERWKIIMGMQLLVVIGMRTLPTIGLYSTTGKRCNIIRMRRSTTKKHQSMDRTRIGLMQRGVNTLPRQGDHTPITIHPIE
jgi:hypothetical protein